jgi:hypothetical protein
MGNYLLECEVEELALRVPRGDAQDLAEYFDGRHPGERGAARAVLQGGELRLESRGGRLVLWLEGNEFVAGELEIFDDREGEFFRGVVLNLAVAYRGDLRCRLRWSAAGKGLQAEGAEVVVEAGESNTPLAAPPGAWLAQPSEVSPEAGDALAEEIARKLEEARRHWAEYQRLKGQREGVSR